jgi:hypothetical protein
LAIFRWASPKCDPKRPRPACARPLLEIRIDLQYLIIDRNERAATLRIAQVQLVGWFSIGRLRNQLLVPRQPDREAAQMAHISVERLAAGDGERDRPEHDEARRRSGDKDADGMRGVQRREHARRFGAKMDKLPTKGSPWCFPLVSLIISDKAP